MARPKRFTKVLQVRLTAAQEEQLREIAAFRGVKVTEWVRLAALMGDVTLSNPAAAAASVLPADRVNVRRRRRVVSGAQARG